MSRSFNLPPRVILVPTDFSPHAEGAIQAASALGRRFDAELHALHSTHLGDPWTNAELALSLPDLRSEVDAAGRRRIEALAAQLEQKGIHCVPHVSALAPPEAIHETAELIKADLICMGTRGLTGLKHLFVGSNAERTLRRAKVPVLCVKADVEAPLEKLETILAPTDFSEQSDAGFDAAIELAAASGARLLIVHAVYVPPELAAWSMTSGGVVVPPLEGDPKQKLDEYVSRCQERGVSCETVCERESPEALVLETARSRSADLICLSTHGAGLSRWLLGSVAERILRGAEAPVLTVRSAS